MSNYQKQPPIVTVAHQFYNSEHGTLQLKFMNRKAVLSIAVINDDQKGKKARRGAMMYDYDNAIGMSLSIAELIIVKANLDALVSGERVELKFSHTFGEAIKNITFGVGQDADENGENGSPYLQIFMEELDRKDPDGEPVAYAWYEFNPNEEEIEGIESLEVEIFKAWVDSGVRVSFLEGSHAQMLNQYGTPKANPRNQGGSGGYKRSGNYQRAGSDGDQGEDGDGQDGDGQDTRQPRRKQTPNKNTNRQQGGGNSRRQQSGQQTGGSGSGPDDDIPF